jgi:hypothetical protein
MALPRKTPNLVNAVPSVLGPFEPFDALCFGFFDLGHDI